MLFCCSILASLQTVLVLSVIIWKRVKSKGLVFISLLQHIHASAIPANCVSSYTVSHYDSTKSNVAISVSSRYTSEHGVQY